MCVSSLWFGYHLFFSDENNIGREEKTTSNELRYNGYQRWSTKVIRQVAFGCEIEERWRMNNKKALANERDARRTGFSPSSFCVFVSLCLFFLSKQARARERTSGGLSNYIYGCMWPELADQSYLSSESVLFLFNCSIHSQTHGL